MTATLPAEPIAPPRVGPSPRALTVYLILGVLAARVLYLFLLSPWELMGDEAYYWEWSRHLALGYYEKGPGTAWMIWPSTTLFGATEGAVRLPVAIFSALSAWAVARLAVRVSGDERAGLLAAIAFVLIPAYQANAQICSQDGPMILAWALLAIIGLRLFRRWEAGRSTWGDWVLVGAVTGIAFLFKQTAVLFLPSFPVYALLRRKQLRWRWTVAVEVLASAAAFFVAVSPMVYWNVGHHWPTVQHTLGHLGAGGDQKETIGTEWSPTWFLSLLGAQLGAFGPAIGLMGWAAWRVGKKPKPAELWLLCAALPGVGFFVLLSLFKPVLANWPMPSFAPLVALVGIAAVGPLDRWRDLRNLGAQNKVKPKRTDFAGAWNAMVVYGVVGWGLISFAPALGRIPVLGRIVPRAVVRKTTGERARAAMLGAQLDALGGRAFVIGSHYMQAALDGFYLPNQPTVYDADVLLGKHPTSYEYWRPTDLADPALIGRRVLLDGGDAKSWSAALELEGIRLTGGSGRRRTYTAVYRGLTPVSGKIWPQSSPPANVSRSGHSASE